LLTSVFGTVDLEWDTW